jgi:hypothetical protein
LPTDGYWRGTHTGQFGQVGTQDTVEGLVSFSLPAVLERKLALVRPGAMTRIVFLGEFPSKRGKPFKDFNVFALGTENLLPESAPTLDEPGAEAGAEAGEDTVPF